MEKEMRKEPKKTVEDLKKPNQKLHGDAFDDAEKLFFLKSEDYTNSGGQSFEDAGLLGQYMKLRDKINKLRKPMRDAEIVNEALKLGLANKEVEDAAVKLSSPLQFEGTEEILMDIIGHCVLSIGILRKREGRDLEESAAAIREKAHHEFLQKVVAEDGF